MADGGGSAKPDVGPGSVPASAGKTDVDKSATKAQVGRPGATPASVLKKPKAADGGATKTDVGSATKTDGDRSSSKTDVGRPSKLILDQTSAKTDVGKSSKADADRSSPTDVAPVASIRKPKQDDDVAATSVVRKPSRRSPTTGHRRKKTDMKRSQSSPREPIVPTSSDDEGRSFPRRKSLSPPGPEPKKTLRRRHRLRDKSLETKEDRVQNETSKESKPPVDIKPKIDGVIAKKDDVVLKKDDGKPKKVDAPAKDPAKPEKPTESKSTIKKELEIEPENVEIPKIEKPQKTEDEESIKPEKAKVKEKVKESGSESDSKRPNSWWGGWTPFKKKETKTDSGAEATGDDGGKLDDYLSTDDETAAEFIKLLAQQGRSTTEGKIEETRNNSRTEIGTKIYEKSQTESKIDKKSRSGSEIDRTDSRMDEKTPLLDSDRPPTVRSWAELFREGRVEFAKFRKEFPREIQILKKLRNRCFCELFLIFILCGCGAFVFKTTEGAFENFYKCGVKRVKRDFIEDLWRSSHFMKEEDWKSKARNKLKVFEEQLAEAFEAGMTSYSGQRSWSFINGIIYCLTVVTTIGYGHIAPVTTSGRALTIAYSIVGIPLFLILLADFGKLFTRCIKFLWAFVRRLYYTGSCRKVRRTGPVQEVMKGMQMVYDTIRRPSMFPQDGTGEVAMDVGTPGEPPSTPALSTFAVDDEFNLPISVAISILLVYIFMGATVFWFWEEDWTFFESFYFVFISMSTIGFGDLVPKNQMYMMASIVYLAFGLALTSMCINVVQEKLSDSFRKASAKIGATIGLKVSEDDGTISPVSPTHVEIAAVHRAVGHDAGAAVPKVP